MKLSHSSHRAVAGLAVVLTGGMVSTTLTTLPAAGATDGPPLITSVVSQSGPTTGGTAIRIYGSGFLGTTSVRFGSVEATKKKVVDGTLITVVVPPANNGAAASNSSVNITVTDDQGADTGHNNAQTGENDGWYYTNATWTVTPTTGLSAGSAITGTLSNYQQSVDMVMPELNPLLTYLEGGPDYPPGPPPYADPLAFPSTNSSGYLSAASNLTNPFNPDGLSYDANAVCPVNQTTANYLGNSAPPSATQPVYAAKCLLAVGQFAIGTLDTPLGFTSDLTPAAPVVTLNKSSTFVGDTVTITNASVNWNANPYFGSTKAATGPGETATTVSICGIGGVATNCSTNTTGGGTVSMTRYKTTSTNTPITGVFSGAKLSGSVVVGSDAAGCSTCFLRARQNRPAGGFIEATAPLSVA